MGTKPRITDGIGAAIALLGPIARRQHGVFTLEQALECGLSSRTIRRWVAECRWVQIHPGVYSMGTSRPDDLQRASAAVLAAGPYAIVSHMSAVALHGLAPWPLHVHLTVPHGRHRNLVGVRWHQSRVLTDEHRTVVRAIPTTTVERSLLDTAAHGERGFVAKLVDECVRTGMSDLGRLASTALEVRPDGRFGGSRLRSVLATVPLLDDADSVMEMAMARLLRAARIDGFVHHHVAEVGETRFELDFAFLAEMVDVECDGAAHHDGPLARERDRARDDALVSAGWTVLRFSWRDVTKDAAATAARIRAALGR